MELENFYSVIEKLRKTPRTGWAERGVRNPETVAEHSHAMAILCSLLAPRGIDRVRAIKMALVHDIAKGESGDPIAVESWKGGSVTEEEKSRMEMEALEKILSGLDPGFAEEVRSLFGEYGETRTKEAVFVRSLNVAQMIIQAVRYHKEGNFEKPLEPFWDDKNLSRIRDESIKSLVMDIIPKGR